MFFGTKNLLRFFLVTEENFCHRVEVFELFFSEADLEGARLKRKLCFWVLFDIFCDVMMVLYPVFTN